MSIQELKEAQRESLIFTISRMTIPQATHKTAAREAAGTLLDIIQIEFTTKLEPSLAQPHYTNSPRAFVIQLPIPLADAAKRLAISFGFQAQETTCKYLLKLDKFASLAGKSPKVLDSFNYFWISLPPGYNATDTITRENISKFIAKAGLEVVSFHHQTDREAGTLIPRCRFSFDLNEQFNVYMLRHVREITMPGGFTIPLMFSEQFCNIYKVHQKCLRFMRGYSCPKDAQDADICACIPDKKRINQRRDPQEKLAAQKAFHDRLKKRRLTEADF